MQDPTLFQQINPQFPEHEQLKCPRCDSKNTKFCYYNNYNLSQPRHYCKNCRRYWTKGGSLRNIPVGGSIRKATKRTTSASKKSSLSSSPSTQNPTVPKSEPFDQDRRVFVAENDQFRSLIEGFGSNGFGKDQILDMNTSSGQNLMRNPVGELHGGNNGGEFSGSGENGDDSSYWVSNNNAWPDLAIYTPGSTFQ